jgi:hypothetical protein
MSQDPKMLGRQSPRPKCDKYIDRSMLRLKGKCASRYDNLYNTLAQLLHNGKVKKPRDSLMLLIATS